MLVTSVIYKININYSSTFWTVPFKLKTISCFSSGINEQRITFISDITFWNICPSNGGYIATHAAITVVVIAHSTAHNSIRDDAYFLYEHKKILWSRVLSVGSCSRQNSFLYPFLSLCFIPMLLFSLYIKPCFQNFVFFSIFQIFDEKKIKNLKKNKKFEKKS